jgi:hypothetical protein
MQLSGQSPPILFLFFSPTDLVYVSWTYFFVRGKAVGLTPNLQFGRPGYYFSSGSSSLTCPAWETLPVAKAPPAFLSGKYTYALYIVFFYVIQFQRKNTISLYTVFFYVINFKEFYLYILLFYVMNFREM